MMKKYSDAIVQSIQSTLFTLGEYALSQSVSIGYQLKQDKTPFTQIEIAMEEKMISFLQTTFPGHQVISEEKGKIGAASSFQWFLDPIDGTKMYIAGAPTWGISLGLVESGNPVLGFFYLPKSRDLFWGGRGYGAFFNSRSLDPSYIPDHEDPLVFFGVPSTFHRRFAIEFPRVRAFGSTAIHMAYVASGASIGMLTRRVNLWDLAGMLPILEQTGVVVEYLSGKPFSPTDILDGSRLPEELLIARPMQLEMLRGMITRI
jgi:myo-inositol-1(or 4)-monophosphatase